MGHFTISYWWVILLHAGAASNSNLSDDKKKRRKNPKPRHLSSYGKRNNTPVQPSGKNMFHTSYFSFTLFFSFSHIILQQFFH